MMRARALALIAGLLVLVGLPLARFAGRASDAAPGDLDLSDAWSWPPVVVAGLATSAAVFFWSLQRDAARARRVGGVHETFEYHDAMLQKVVTARMAIELDQSDRAGLVLDGVIESASGVISSFVEETGVDRRTGSGRQSSWD